MQASSCRPVGCCLRSFSDRKHSRQAAVHALQCSAVMIRWPGVDGDVLWSTRAWLIIDSEREKASWAPRAAMPMAEWISAKVRGRAQVCVLRTHAFFHGARPAPAWPRLQVAGDHPWSWSCGAARVKTQKPKKWRSRRDG